MLRRATPDDAHRLAWLRATSFGTRCAPDGFVACSTAGILEHLRGGDFAAFLAEEGETLVSYGATMIHRRLPTPSNPSGRWGYIQALETLGQRPGLRSGGGSLPPPRVRRSDGARRVVARRSVVRRGRTAVVASSGGAPSAGE